MECLLHIAYRLEIKTWQVRSLENKQKVAQKKAMIKGQFEKQLDLLVDMPKQHAGNTNDGNTARVFFRNAEKSANITGININLIQRFHVILECLGSGYDINSEAFENYAADTREMYLKEYSWYYMPVSVHKVLFHGKLVIDNCILPIGQMSEEAQEARNKDTRRYRLEFTRKTSRIHTNEDLLHRLLMSSDPYICSLRKSPKTKRGVLTPEILQLLKEPEINFYDYDSE